jgi:hypothetical protein
MQRNKTMGTTTNVDIIWKEKLAICMHTKWEVVHMSGDMPPAPMISMARDSRCLRTKLIHCVGENTMNHIIACK